MSVKLQSLRKEFGSHVAVPDLNLTIEDGEFFVLLGPSGCGKTTTLRMIAGLETPSGGKVEIDGVDVTVAEPRKRDIAMVFQDYGLYPHMRVRDNIAFPLKIRGMDKAVREEKAEEVARRLHIEHLLNRKPPALSGGEKQRVSLARALVRNPKIFLMDEPLSNLDAKLRITMRAEIKRLVSDLKITTIYVTHDQIEAMAMADRIGVMDKGHMIQVDKPTSIYDHPSNIFVAQFIGSPPMNTYRGHLWRSHQLEIAPSFFATFIEPDRLRKILHNGSEKKDVVVGVRPEDVQIEAQGANHFAMGVVELIEPLGQDTYVYLAVDGSEMIAVTKRSNFRVGETVGIRISSDRIHLFDGKSGDAYRI